MPENIALYTLDWACLQSTSPEEKRKLNVDPNKENPPQISEEQNFDQQNIIALIVSPEACRDCLRFARTTQILFQDAYAKPRSYSDRKSDDVRLIKPTWFYPINYEPTDTELNRLRFAYYPNPKIMFHRGLGYENPQKIIILRDELMIFGSELNRFIELNRELKLMAAASNPKVKNTITAKELGQEAFKKLVLAIEAKLTENGDKLPLEWPGVELDIAALARVWGKHNKYAHLIRATTTLRDYRRGILNLEPGSEQTDFYIDLFSEFKDEIIQERNSLILKNEERTKLKRKSQF